MMLDTITRNKRKIIGLYILVATVCALALLAANHYRRAKPRRKAKRIIAVGDIYVIDNQMFLVVDSNESAAAVGAIATRDKVFYLVDLNQPAGPWYFPRVEWPSSCYLSSDPNAGVTLQALDNYAENFRRKTRYSAAEK